MDEEPLDGEVIYAHEKSLEEVLSEITGKDPKKSVRHAAETPIRNFDTLTAATEKHPRLVQQQAPGGWQ